MRKRRIEAKTRIAVKVFLAGNAGAAETCLAISRGTYHDSTLLSEEAKNYSKPWGARQMIFQSASCETTGILISYQRS